VALTFEWDENKSERNFKKHDVDFEEAKTIFNDPFAIKAMVLIIRLRKIDILTSDSPRKKESWSYGIPKEMIIFE
jgi:hypothetical protein